MFKKVKKFELHGRICAAVATGRLERMDILSGKNQANLKKIIKYNTILEILINKVKNIKGYYFA